MFVNNRSLRNPIVHPWIYVLITIICATLIILFLWTSFTETTVAENNRDYYSINNDICKNVPSNELLTRLLFFPDASLALCPIDDTIHLMKQTKTNFEEFKIRHWSHVNILMLINPLDRLSEFYQNVIHAGHNSHLGRLRADLIKRLSMESIAFKDFVSFIFNNTNDGLLTEYREFYYPISTMCQPCQIDYQYIVNFEDPGTVSSLQRQFDNRGLTLLSRNGTPFAQVGRKSKMLRKSRLYEMHPTDIRKVIEFYEIDRKLLGAGLW